MVSRAADPVYDDADDGAIYKNNYTPSVPKPVVMRRGTEDDQENLASPNAEARKPSAPVSKSHLGSMLGIRKVPLPKQSKLNPAACISAMPGEIESILRL